MGINDCSISQSSWWLSIMIVILYSCIPQVVSCRWEKYRSSVDPFAFAMTQCIPNSIIEHLTSSITPRRDVYLLPQPTDHLKLYLGSMPKQSAISWAPVTHIFKSIWPFPPTWPSAQFSSTILFLSCLVAVALPSTESPTSPEGGRK